MGGDGEATCNEALHSKCKERESVLVQELTARIADAAVSSTVCSKDTNNPIEVP